MVNVLHGPGWEVAVDDVRAALRKLPAASVDCCITSPPYWGLRDYGVAGQLGLEPSLEAWLAGQVEVFEEVRRVLKPWGTLWVNMGDSYAQGGRGGVGDTAGLEGGRQNLDEGRKALARIGGRMQPTGTKPKDLIGQPWRLAFALRAAGWYLRAEVIWAKPNPMPESIKDRPTKSHENVFLLTPQPTYYYDNDAIREDYSPASEQRRQYKSDDLGNRRGVYQPGQPGQPETMVNKLDPGKFYEGNPMGRNRRSVWSIPVEPFRGEHFATFPTALVEPMIRAGSSEKGNCPSCGRPWKRVVFAGEQDLEWAKRCGADVDGEYLGVSEKHGETAEDYERLRARQDATSPRKQAEGAGQNPSDVKARILAGLRYRTTIGWRPTCGCSPARALAVDARRRELGEQHPSWLVAAERSVLVTLADDWRCADPSCPHVLRQHGREGGHCGRCRCEFFKWGDQPFAPIPATVLDCYSGAATTGVVARRLGRRYLGVELNPKYAAMSAKRIREDELRRDFGGEKPKTEAEATARAAQMKLFEVG